MPTDWTNGSALLRRTYRQACDAPREPPFATLLLPDDEDGRRTAALLGLQYPGGMPADWFPGWNVEGAGPSLTRRDKAAVLAMQQAAYDRAEEFVRCGRRELPDLGLAVHEPHPSLVSVNRDAAMEPEGFSYFRVDSKSQGRI